MTLLGPTPTCVPSLVTIGPRAWEELRDKQTDKQTFLKFSMTRQLPVSMKHATLELQLSSLKFGLDPMGSLLGPNLIHLPSLVRSVLGVLEIMKIFKYDLQPRDLDL